MHYPMPVFGFIADKALPDIIGYVFNIFNKGNGKLRIRQLLRPCCRPKAIVEVVIFDRTVILNLSISAMMIGKNKSLRRDNLSGTSFAKLHYGIFERTAVGVVNVVIFEFEPPVLSFEHIFAVSANAASTFLRRQKCRLKTRVSNNSIKIFSYTI